MRTALIVMMVMFGCNDASTPEEEGAASTATVPGGTGGGGGTAGELSDCDLFAYEQVRPLHEFTMEEFGGLPTLRWIPDNPSAVLIAFHGSGGEIGKLMQLHYYMIWNALTEANIAIVGIESVDRQSKTWDTWTRDPSENTDFQNISAWRDHLIAETGLSETTPIVSWGFSNGGSYTGVFAEMGLAEGWPMLSVDIHSSHLEGDVGDLPVFLTAPENDDILSSTRGSYEAHSGAGHVAEFHETAEHPFDRREMLFHPSYDEVFAGEVADELVALGMIEQDGTRITDANDVDSAMNYYSNNSELAGPARVTPLIRVAWATHRVSGEYACQERDFVLQALQSR
jgi:predicted esterase